MKLRVTPHEREPFDYELAEGSIVIGRSSTADLALADPFLSRHHARLTRRGDSLLVEDLGARNGTFLNEVRVETRAEVHPGDEIKLAGSRLLRVEEGALLSDVMTRSELGAPTLVRRAADILAEESSAFDLTRGGAALQAYVGRLETLRLIHRDFSRAASRDDLLRIVLERAFALFAPGQGDVYLRDHDGEFRRTESSPPESPSGIPLPEEMVDQVLRQGLAVVARVDDPRSSPPPERSAVTTGALAVAGTTAHAAAPSSLSVIAAPLLDGGASFGMLVLSRDAHAQPFSAEQIDLLVELAGEAALELRKIALAGEAEQKRLLERELALARRIQLGILPGELPAFEGYSLLGHNIPSRGVSGDFYMATRRRDGEECLLLMGDVSGKGFAASLVTASLEALSTVMIEAGHAPDEMCTRLSRQLFDRTLPGGFVTAFVATLDRGSGRLVYTNAGNNPALLVRPDGSVEELQSIGLPLGIMRHSVYGSRQVFLEPGATLVLYTDGITEAADREDEQYGLERLKACLVRHREAALEEIRDAIQADLDAFVAGVPYVDDRTVLMVRRSPDATGTPPSTAAGGT